MTFGYVLIVLVAVALGGLIATVGDRLGSRVGKARLRLFNLRPRQTATVITIATGGLISASTLGLIVLLGVLELEQVQTQLRKARQDLEGASAAQKDVSASLNRLRTTQRVTQGQLRRSRATLKEATQKLEAAEKRFSQVSKRATALQTDIKKLGQERQRLDQQLQRLQVDRDRLGVENQRKGEQIAEREAQLQVVGTQLQVTGEQLQGAQRQLQAAQQQFLTAQRELERLTAEVRSLEEESQNLRGGSVALRRGQVLTAGLVKLRSPTDAQEAVQQLLLSANQVASQAIRPGLEEVQVIRISRSEVDGAIAQLQDQEEYLVRVVVGANYVVGEEPVRVGLEVVENRILFAAGDVLTGSIFGRDRLTRREVRDRLELLIAQAQFRARRAGMVLDTPQVLTVDGLVRLALWLEDQQNPIEVKVLAGQALQTAGPLLLRFVAVQGDRIIFDSAANFTPGETSPIPPSP